MDITCILNTSAHSNGAQAAREQLLSLFEQHGVHVTLVMAENGEMLKAAANDAAQRGGLVVAGGGDGTIGTVAASVIDGNAILGVLPLGTLNHFARDLGIPLDLQGAVATLFNGQVRQVDVGRVNDRIFLNNSSLGLYPAIVRHRDVQQSKGHGKWSAFALACLYALRRNPPLSIQLKGAGQTLKSKWSPFLFVGNNRYTANGFNIGTRERLDDGKLYVYRAAGRHRVSLVKMAVAALFNRLSRRELDIIGAGDFIVASRKSRMHVALDGEVALLETPLYYRILPGALRVMAPAGKEA